MKKQTQNQSKKVEKKATITKSTKAFWEKRYFFEALVFCFSFVLFANSIPNDYNMDDELVTINHRLTSKGIAAIPEIFSSPYYQDASGYSYEYRPVVLASFAIEHDIFGDNAHWSHFWNVILYSIVCVLLLKVLRLLFRNYSPLIPIGVSLLFVAHPAHTEVVCSIKNRDEILGLLFSLLSFYFALTSIVKNRKWELIFVPLFFSIAILSKITFIPFIIIIPLSVLIFTDMEIGFCLFLFLLLFIPVLQVLDIGNTTTKILFVLGVFLVFLAIYAYKKREQLKYVTLEFIKRGINNSISNFTEEEKSNIGWTYSLKDCYPPTADFSIKSFFWVTILTAFFALGAIGDSLLLQIICAFILVIVSFEKEESSGFWSMCSLYILILFKIYTLKLYLLPYFLDFTALPLIYSIIYGRRNFLIPHLLSFAAIIVFYFLQPMNAGGFLYPFLLFVVLYLQRFRFGWIVAVFSFLIMFFTILFDPATGVHDFAINTIDNISVTLLAFFIYYKRQHSLVGRIYFVFIIAMSIFLKPNYESDKALISKATKTISNVDLNPKSATPVNRPIHFVENCIDFLKTPIEIKTGTSLEILLYYLTKTIVPYPLSFYYGYSFIKPMKMAETIPLISLILHVVLLFVAIFCWKKSKPISFGLLVYLISIGTFSNFFQLVPGMLADRFLLVPSLGWLIVLVAVFTTIFNLKNEQSKWSEGHKYAKYLFISVLLFYSTLTFYRNFNWKDYLTLFEHDISYVDNSSQAHNLLALRLMKKSFEDNITTVDQLEMRKKAAIHFRRAVEIYPPFFNANYDLGRTYQLLGNADSAIYFYKKTVLLDSSFTNASLSVGELLMQQNKASEAIPYFENLIKQFPKDFTGYDKLSYAFFLQKEIGKSIEVLQKAKQEIPQNPQPCISLAKVYHTINRDDSTRYWLQKAIEIEPSNQEAKGLLQNLRAK